MKPLLLAVACAALALAGGHASAQVEVEPGHDISGVDVAVPGATLSIPLPEERQADPRRYETPELAGAEPAIGSHLVDGHLPRPLVDYITRVGPVLQRISVFENGLVSAHLHGAGGTVRKKLLLPLDGLEAIRPHLDAQKLSAVPLSFSPDRRAADFVELRVYDDRGRPVSLRFHPETVLPAEIERPRSILQDLMRAIAQDREVTNTLARYVPKVGDRLIGEDQKAYEIAGISKDGEGVTLRSLADPIQLYVSTKDLHKFFVGKPVSASR